MSTFDGNMKEKKQYFEYYEQTERECEQIIKQNNGKMPGFFKVPSGMVKSESLQIQRLNTLKKKLLKEKSLEF